MNHSDDDSRWPRRARVLRALAHKETDRVPVDFGGTSASSIIEPAYRRLTAFLGTQPQICWMRQRPRVVIPDEATLERLDVDTRAITLLPNATGAVRFLKDGVLLDEWGNEWRAPEGRHYYESKWPLAGALTLNDLKSYHWPDPTDASRYAGLADRARTLRERSGCAVVLDFDGGFFEQSWKMRGMDTFLMDLVADQPLATALMDHILEIQVEILSRALRAADDWIDIVYVHNDMGTQSGPLISPETYLKLVAPRQRRMVDAVRKYSNARVVYHSDGAVHWLIKHLIEMGIDALDPIQVSAAGMNPANLKRDFGERIAFWGGIDTQDTLPMGTPEQVRAEVRQRIEEFGVGGGYVLAPTQGIQEDVPPENLVAMIDEAHKYRLQRSVSG